MAGDFPEPRECPINAISFINDNETLNDLIEKADVALYESKKKGKNCISVYDEADIKKR